MRKESCSRIRCVLCAWHKCRERMERVCVCVLQKMWDDSCCHRDKMPLYIHIQAWIITTNWNASQLIVHLHACSCIRRCKSKRKNVLIHSLLLSPILIDYKQACIITTRTLISPVSWLYKVHAYSLFQDCRGVCNVAFSLSLVSNEPLDVSHLVFRNQKMDCHFSDPNR